MKKLILLTVLLVGIIAMYGADINVSGYTLHQNNSTQSFSLPDTIIPEGWYMVIGRNATQSAFENEWGSLPGNVIYINSGGSCPQINGGENYYITDGASAVVDSALEILSSGNTAERDSTNVNTWVQSVRTDGTPGTGAVGGFGVGLVINEYADAVTYSNEFVELYNDGTGAAPNVPPSASASYNPSPLRDGDQLSIVAVITDDYGVAADTLFGRLNGGSWLNWTNDSISGNNYYYTNIGTFNEGDIVDFYVKAVDDSSASGYSDTTTINVQAQPSGDSLNILNYQIKQYNASYTYTFGDITLYDGDYIVIGRNADQAAFETFWSISLPANATYINGNNSALSINGGETFSLHNDGGSTIDSSTEALSGGNTVVRDATNLDSWTQSAYTNATPGSGVTGGNGAGFVITEYSDASGTGNYIYEFVEVYFDGSGTPSNTPPVMDSTATVPQYNEPGDEFTFIQYMHDNSGIAYDTCFLKVGDGGSWTAVVKDSSAGQAYYYPAGPFNQYDSVYVYVKAIDDSSATTYSDTLFNVMDYYTPVFSAMGHNPDPAFSGNTIITYAHIEDYNGSIALNRMYYWVNGGSVSNTVNDSMTDNNYYYTLGSFSAGDTVSYYFFARDDDVHSETSDTFSFIVVAAPDYSVKVNEFCSNGPSGGDATSEWVELFNTSGSSVDISGYYISDEEGTITIPSGTMLGGGEFYVLLNDIDSFNAYFTLPGGVSYFEYKDSISGSFGLSNSGDQIILYNPESVEIDYVNYGTGTNPAPNPGDGESATRNPDGTDTDDCSVDFSISSTPTPGSGIVSGPALSGFTRNPILPLSTEEDTVWVTATDADGIANIYLVVHSSIPSDIDTVAMAVYSGDEYYAIVGPYADECRIEYDIYAVDNVSDTTFHYQQGKFFWGYTSIPKLKQVDENGYPVYYSYQLRSTGIATTESNVYSAFADIFNFQENYILGAVFKTDTSASNVIPGDSVTVTGTIDIWNGQTRIEDPYTSLIIHSSGHVIDTIFITADQLMDTTGETYEGLLAVIDCYGIHSGTWPTAGNNAGLWMKNDSIVSKGTLTDTFYMWVDSDTDIDGMAEPGWYEKIVGIISQYDTSTPYFSGYQFLPRDSMDVSTGLTTSIHNFFVTLSIEREGVILRWNIEGTDDIASFRVERREPGEDTYKVLASLTPNDYEYSDRSATLDKLYEYRVLAITTNGGVITYRDIRTPRSMLIANKNASIENNTVKNGTWMNFVSPKETHLSAALYDISGRNILTVADNIVGAGYTNLYVNTGGVASGIYFLRIQSEDFSQTIKLNIVK